MSAHAARASGPAIYQPDDDIFMPIGDGFTIPGYRGVGKSVV